MANVQTGMSGRIAQSRNPWASSQYGGNAGYDDIFQKIMQAGAGSGWDSGKTQTTLDQYGNDFAQQFQNAVGRAPTADEINAFYTQAVSPVLNTQSGFANTDPNAIAQQYIPQAYGSQVRDNQMAQANTMLDQLTQRENTALQNNINTVQGAIPGIAKNVTDTFTNGSGLQSVLGAMNNAGVLHGGATNEAVGTTLANDINAQISPLISGLVGGATNQMQNNPQQAFGLSQGNIGNFNQMGLGAQGSLTSRNNDLYDFNLQSELAQKLQQMMEPSGAEKDMAMASQAAGAVGNLAGAGSKAAATSYVCLELIKRGLLCQSDLDEFHVHIMPAMFKKGRAFWKYAMDAQKLVEAVNAMPSAENIWATFKPLFFDCVVAEPDAAKAVDLYSSACEWLCTIAAPRLWDPRVYRTSAWDSALFLPRLLTYRPFLEALWKCVRIKMLFLYDKPGCIHGA